jgi:hypothetical protein
MATLRMPSEWEPKEVPEFHNGFLEFESDPDEGPALEMTRDEAMRLMHALRNNNTDAEAEGYAGGSMMLALVDFPVSFNISY